MDTRPVRALFDAQMRKAAPGQGQAHSPGPGPAPGRNPAPSPPQEVVRLVEGGPHGWAGVVWSDLDETTADAAIAAQLDWLNGPEADRDEFEWKLYSHDRPADLGARLRAAGFVPEPPETVMVAETAALATRPQPLPEGVSLHAVTDAAGVDLVADVHEQAFGRSAGRLRGAMRDQLAEHPELLSIVVAVTDGGEPVCAARTEFHPGTDFASLWGGGTVEAWRGRGIYRALVSHRAREAAARGVRYVQVDAADTSRPILERLGFAPLAVTTPYVVRPGRPGTREDA